MCKGVLAVLLCVTCGVLFLVEVFVFGHWRVVLDGGRESSVQSPLVCVHVLAWFAFSMCRLLGKVDYTS